MKAFCYRQPVQTHGFLPDCGTIETTPFGGFLPEKKVTFSGRGHVEFPLPEKENDPIWVKLEEHPHPIIPYEHCDIS